MFTVCPKCALTLVVTAADLKVAQGYVRCGRCSNVFNAIAALSDDRQPSAGLEGYVQPETPPSPADEKLEFDPVATKVSEVFVEPQIGDDEATGTFESIVLETGEPDPSEPAVEQPPSNPDRELEQELQSLAQRIEAERHPPIASAAVKDTLLPDLDSRRDAGTENEELEHFGLWVAGIAALVLMLITQVVNHYRHDLAVIPQLNGPLTAIYRTLGVSLVPRWNLSDYEVRQLGATTDPADENQLIVRASVKNAARQPQPLPLLHVAVQDRFGNRIAARDVAPESYVPRTVPARALLAAGQRIDVEMRFVDPGKEAVGFEIDACLLAPGGGVNCANR